MKTHEKITAEKAIEKLNAIKRRWFYEDLYWFQIEAMVDEYLEACVKDGVEEIEDNFYGTIYRFSDGREIRDTIGAWANYGWEVIKRN